MRREASNSEKLQGAALSKPPSLKVGGLEAAAPQRMRLGTVPDHGYRRHAMRVRNVTPKGIFIDANLSVLKTVSLPSATQTWRHSR
jgi:hypothetical protein